MQLLTKVNIGTFLIPNRTYISKSIYSRIWDYPIKEQYGHILLAINSSNPVKNAAEGFRKVSEHENADFAFIHDSAEIKYEISKNCNLTEIGEVFAEQPYAIAIQQGSHLQVLSVNCYWNLSHQSSIIFFPGPTLICNSRITKRSLFRRTHSQILEQLSQKGL